MHVINQGWAANEWHMVQCPLPADTSGVLVWRLPICINTPSGVVRRIHHRTSSDLCAKRVRAPAANRYLLWFVIWRRLPTPFSNPPIFLPFSLVSSYTVFRTTINHTDKVFAPKTLHMWGFLLPHINTVCLVVAWKIMLAMGKCNC